MSLAAIVDALFEAGATREMIVAAIQAHESSLAPVRTARQERNRRHYEVRKESLKENEASESVLKRLKASEKSGDESSPSLPPSPQTPQPPTHPRVVIPPIVPQKGDDEVATKPILRQAHVEQIWEIVPRSARVRTSKKDILGALQAAARRGKRPEDVVSGLRAYYASLEATKDGGQYAKGAHRMIANDRWESFVESVVVDFPDQPINEQDVWRKRVDRFFNGSGWWDTGEWGPMPGRDGCLIDQSILSEFSFRIQAAE